MTDRVANAADGFLTRPVDLFYVVPVLDRVLLHLGRAIDQQGSILDVGCGLGEKTESFRRLGMTAVGMDVDPRRIASASREYPLCHFHLGSIEALPFGDNAFDALFSSSVLQYADRGQALAECRRVLKPGGKAVFIENLKHHPVAALYRTVRRWSGRSYGVHVTPKSHLGLNDLDEFRAHFSEVCIEPYNLLSTLAIAIPTLHEALHREKMLTLKPVRTHDVLSRIDRVLLKRFPSLKRYCWTALILVA
jgi:SAM-dependent methyltransferase